MILLTDRHGKKVRYGCGHRSLIVPPVVGVYSRRCDICRRWTVAEVRRSDIQDRALIVEVRPVAAVTEPADGSAAGDVRRGPAPSPATQLSLTPQKDTP